MSGTEDGYDDLLRRADVQEARGWRRNCCGDRREARSAEQAIRMAGSLAAMEGRATRARQAAGRILWFTWNKLAGSYFFFNAARRW